MREWLEETHGPGFELLRHFLLRFFDSDLVTASGQTSTALIGAFSILLPWYPLIVGPLRHKYAYLSALPAPGPYRMAVRAGPCARHSDRRADHHQSHTFLHDQGQDAAALRAESDADADLAASLRHRVGRHAGQSHGGEHESEDAYDAVGPRAHA